MEKSGDTFLTIMSLSTRNLNATSRSWPGGIYPSLFNATCAKENLEPRTQCETLQTPFFSSFVCRESTTRNQNVSVRPTNGRSTFKVINLLCLSKGKGPWNENCTSKARPLELRAGSAKSKAYLTEDCTIFGLDWRVLLSSETWNKVFWALNF